MPPDFFLVDRIGPINLLRGGKVETLSVPKAEYATLCSLCFLSLAFGLRPISGSLRCYCPSISSDLSVPSLPPGSALAWSLELTWSSGLLFTRFCFCCSVGSIGMVCKRCQPASDLDHASINNEQDSSHISRRTTNNKYDEHDSHRQTHSRALHQSTL